MTGDVRVSPREVRGYYVRNQDLYRRPASRRVRHVLLPDEAAAETVVARLAHGEAMDALAAELSIDPGSRARGGDLGDVHRGEFSGPLEDAIFAAGVGSVVGPIQTEHGWHVARVEAITPAWVVPFAEARPAIEAELRAAARDRGVRGLAGAPASRSWPSSSPPSSIPRIPSTACRVTGIERTGTAAMTRIVVTGGSGKAGRAVVHDLVENGHDVVNVDVVPASPTEAPFLRADLTDYGEAIEALRGADAVVHLAAIPAPRIRTVEQTFEINILSTYNVFSAAALLGLERVVWASSETVLGLPFGRLYARNLLDPAAEPGHHPEPDYVPIDEAHPLRPHSSYSLSKVASEEMARQFARWTGIPFIGLRFSAIREPDEYLGVPGGLGRRAPQRVERVGLRRRPRCRPVLPPGPDRGSPRRRGLHHRRRRHGHGSSQRGAPRRMLPVRAGAARDGRLRHPLVDRQGPPGARLYPAPLVA